jgi:hypothetical protein
MKLPSPYACDVCKTIKAEVNHWWFVDTCIDRTLPQISVRPFVAEEADADLHDWKRQHVCSQQHVQTLVQQWMSSLNLPPPRAMPAEREETDCAAA